MIYLFLYIVVLLSGLFLCRVRLIFERKRVFNRKKSIQGWNAFLVFVFLLFVLVAGFRSSEVGADTYSYTVLFNKFVNGESFKAVKSIATTIEDGYLVLIKIISMFTGNTVIFYMVHAIIIYGCFLKYLKENSEDVVMSVLFFTALYFTSTFNIMRQYLAIGLILSAVTVLNKKRYLQAFGLCVTAMLIHRASVVMFPILFIVRIKNKQQKLLGFELLLLLSGVLIRIPGVLNRILFLMNYSRYINSYHMAAADSSGLMAYIYLLIVLIGLGIIYFQKKQLDDNYCFNLMISSVGAMFAIMTTRNAMFARVGAGYSYFFIILFPMIVKKLFGTKDSYRRASFIIYILLFAAAYFTGRGYAYSLTSF